MSTVVVSKILTQKENKMKFDLTLKDLTQQQAARVLNLMNEGANERVTAELPISAGKTPQSVKDIPPTDLYNKIAASENKPLAPIPQVYNTVNTPQPYVPPAAPQPAANADLDKRGFQWDERIHASTKVKTAKGIWKSKRGVSDELVNTVENELRSKGVPNFDAPAQPTAPQLTPEQIFNQNQAAQPYVPPAAPMQPQPPATGGFYRGDNQPPAAPQQPIVNQPAPPAAHDYGGLMTRISVLFSQNLVTTEYLTEFAGKIGQAFNKQVNAITDIAGDQNMINYAIQILQSEGKW